MKKTFKLFNLGIITLVFLASCVSGKQATKSNTNTDDYNNGAIPFKQHYTSKAGTPLTFDIKKIRGLDFQISKRVSLGGDVFDQNLKVEGGQAWVINASLDALKNISTLTDWKAEEFQIDPVSGEITSILMMKKSSTATYYFLFRKSSVDDSFILDSSTPGRMVYQGKVHEVLASEAVAYYIMNDPD